MSVAALAHVLNLATMGAGLGLMLAGRRAVPRAVLTAALLGWGCLFAIMLGGQL